MALSNKARVRLASFQVWPALAYGALILVFGSLPVAPPGAAEVSDKTLHFVVFGIFAVLASRAFGHVAARAPRRVTLARGFGAALALGGVLELWQALLPYRSCEWLDWAADAGGAALGVLIVGVAGALASLRAAAP